MMHSTQDDNRKAEAVMGRGGGGGVSGYGPLTPESLNHGLRHFQCHYESHFFAVHQLHFGLAFTHFKSAHTYDCRNYRSKCPRSHRNFVLEN